MVITRLRVKVLIKDPAGVYSVIKTGRLFIPYLRHSYIFFMLTKNANIHWLNFFISLECMVNVMYVQIMIKCSSCYLSFIRFVLNSKYHNTLIVGPVSLV